MFALTCVLFGLLIFVGFLVIFLPSEDNTPENTLALRRPFSKLYWMDQ